MLTDLMKNRIRPPLGGLAWLKVWIKRVLQLPMLTKQWRYHRRLRRCGARVAASSFFSDAGLINGSAVKDLVVGEESFIGRAEIAAHAPVIVGRRVCVNDGVHLLTASHDLDDPAWRSRARPIILKDYSWLATNAIILPGVTIGVGAVVGAGAVVSRDVPDFAVVVGSPARMLSRRRVETLDYSPVNALALHEAWLGRAEDMGDHTQKVAAG